MPEQTLRLESDHQEGPTSASVWDERIRIGMLVEVTGWTLKGRTYGNHSTTRVRWTIPAQGRVKVMVLGRSYRFSGKLEGGYNSDDPVWLSVKESHPVWMVQPLKGNRYMRPLAVYQDQIVLEEKAYPAGLVSLTIQENGEKFYPEVVMPAQAKEE